MPPRVLASGPKPCGGNNVRSQQRILDNFQSHLLEELWLHFFVIGVKEPKRTTLSSLLLKKQSNMHLYHRLQRIPSLTVQDGYKLTFRKLRIITIFFFSGGIYSDLLPNALQCLMITDIGDDITATYVYIIIV